MYVQNYLKENLKLFLQTNSFLCPVRSIKCGIS